MDPSLLPSPMPTIGPGIIAQIHVGVIAAVTTLAAVIFIAVYIQLFLVVCFGYKLLSYQTVFLFNIICWASLRLCFYSLYFYHCCELVNNLPVPVQWLLISAPSIFLFISLALLVHYFMEHTMKALERRQELFNLNPSYRTIGWCKIAGTCVWIVSLVLFISVNVVLGIFIDIGPDEGSNFDPIAFSLRIPRVVILESLILLMGLALGIFIIIIYTTRAGKDVMESKQVSKAQAVIISSLLIVLFCSRALYNIITVAMQSSNIHPFGYDAFATNMADFDHQSKEGDIIYFIVVLLWEIIPVCLIVIFFRVRKPSTLKLLTYHRHNEDRSKHFFSNSTPSNKTIQSSVTRSIGMSIPPSHSQPLLPPSKPIRAGYGSTHYSAPSKYVGGPNSYMPGTTPPQLFTASPSLFTEIQTLNN